MSDERTNKCNSETVTVNVQEIMKKEPDGVLAKLYSNTKGCLSSVRVFGEANSFSISDSDLDFVENLNVKDNGDVSVPKGVSLFDRLRFSSFREETTKVILAYQYIGRKPIIIDLKKGPMGSGIYSTNDIEQEYIDSLPNFAVPKGSILHIQEGKVSDTLIPNRGDYVYLCNEPDSLLGLYHTKSFNVVGRTVEYFKNVTIITCKVY